MIETLEILTVDDVVRSGACVEGVREWRDARFPGETVVSVDDALARTDDESVRAYIERACGRSWDGSGSGCGYGDGYGDGDGDG